LNRQIEILDNKTIIQKYKHDVSNYRLTSLLTPLPKLLEKIMQSRFMDHLEVNGKAIPLQAWTVPEGSRRLRLQHFKTTGT